jgi:hypothetical protein
MDATCKDCGAPINFGAHPTSPGKKAPFDESGMLHWKTCTKPRKNVFNKMSDIPPCKICKASAKYVYKKVRPDTGSLIVGARCENLHFMTWIPKVKENLKLINSTEDQLDEIIRKRIEAM